MRRFRPQRSKKPEEKEKARQAARVANAALDIPPRTDQSAEELRARMVETMRARGIFPEDRPALRELLMLRYPDDWEEALHEHGIEVK